MESITISKNLTEFERNFFEDFPNLQEILIKGGNTHFKSIDGVLYDYAVSTLIFCPSRKKHIEIPATVTTIGADAFRQCTELTEVKIPNSVTTIESFAFSGCKKLANLIIPESDRSSPVLVS